jgi:hypothetical protein
MIANKKRGALLLIAAVLLLPFYNVAQIPGSNGPVLTFKSDTFDFGIVPLHGNQQYEISFKNTGNEPLIITDVRTGDPHYGAGPKEPIAPGKNGVIMLYVPTDCPRKFNKSLYVNSNCSKKPQHVLSIIGTVLTTDSSCANLVLENDSFDIGKVKLNKTMNVKVKIKNTGTIPLVIGHIYYKEYFPRTLYYDYNGSNEFRPMVPQEHVPPGSTITLLFPFDTKAEGIFLKEAEIYSNSGTGPVKVIIKGQVKK